MLNEIQKEDQPALDSLIEENKRIAKEAEEEKKLLIAKIKKLEDKFISTPFELPQEYKKERNIRQQKLSFMQQNYQKLEDEVKEMREQLVQLRRKYKAASKEIFQMENQHEKERQIIQEEFTEVKMQNVMLRSVLNVLFTEKQLKNIMSLGHWQSSNKFKLPAFYFKDRHTLAFPCEEGQNEQPVSSSSSKTDAKEHSVDKYHTTTTSFGARINGGQVGKGFVSRRK